MQRKVHNAAHQKMLKIKGLPASKIPSTVI